VCNRAKWEGPFMALLSRHAQCADECLLLGAKRALTNNPDL
jgi:hypothetical protein